MLFLAVWAALKKLPKKPIIMDYEQLLSSEKDVMQIKFFSGPTELGAGGPGGLMPPQNIV